MVDMTELLSAAKEIDDLAKKQEFRSQAFTKLAADDRNPKMNKDEIRKMKCGLDSSLIIDFGSAIERLRLALR